MNRFKCLHELNIPLFSLFLTEVFIMIPTPLTSILHAGELLVISIFLVCRRTRPRTFSLIIKINNDFFGKHLIGQVRMLSKCYILSEKNLSISKCKYNSIAPKALQYMTC